MDPPPPTTAVAAAKLRLLISFNGQILPRPNTTSLTYAGGDTKLISLHRPSLSLSSLTTHLSKTLSLSPNSFSVKYQLPGEDLDNLVSVSSDEDLNNMVEEHEGVPRIRLFLFPVREELGFNGSKSDLWFSDALEGTMARRGDVVGGGIKGGQESMGMETGSSFGSTGSTVSMTNMGENRSKLASSGSIESDNTTSAISHQYTATYQDPNVHSISPETMARPTLIEPTPVYHNPPSNYQVLKTVQAGAHQPSNQIHHQQELQYIQGGSHYIPQYSATPSYYPMYYPPLNQHAHNPYQPNQPYPVYYVPVRPTQAYNTPMPPHPQMHTHVPKEEVSASTTPLIQVPTNQNQQQLVDLSDMDHTTQAVVNSEFDDEFAYTQIYKTQPSGPTLISQYQTVASGDNIK